MFLRDILLPSGIINIMHFIIISCILLTDND